MRAKISAALVAAMAMASPALAASPTLASWEIAGQFRANCPAAPGANFWTYGTKISGPFFPLTVPFSNAPFSEKGCSQSAGGSFPLVSQNQKTVVNTYGVPPITVGARSLILHPGALGELAVVRFTAPFAGQYTISGRFYGIDGNSTKTTTNVAIVRSGSATPIFTGVIDIVGFKFTASFTSKTFDLASGEHLDFQVGFGLTPGANFNFDSTGLHGVIERAVCNSPVPCD